ncbi:CHAP domain-containing protein [Gemmatimonas sp.]
MTTTLACRWLDPLTDPLAELRRALVRRAHADIGVEENMGAPNRSPYIDEVITEAGSPLESAWCGCIARRWAKDAGAAYPKKDAGAVRVWVKWAQANGLWRDVASGYEPKPGDWVCYDMAPDGIADHIGVVARVHARGVRSIEGNTSWAGFSREGVAVAMKPVTTARIVGYIVLTRATV